MYADDTTRISVLENFAERHNAKEIEHNTNREIYKVTTCLYINKLRPHASKSKFMIILKGECSVFLKKLYYR